MTDAFLVPDKTIVAAKGDGPTVEVKPAESRVFLLTLAITNIIEQESLDVSVHGSAEGVTWVAICYAPFHALLFPGAPLHPPIRLKAADLELDLVTRRAVRGERLLDLTARPEVKFIRAHWEVARWGRGTETPMFEFHVMLREVPREILAEAAGRARAQ